MEVSVRINIVHDDDLLGLIRSRKGFNQRLVRKMRG